MSNTQDIKYLIENENTTVAVLNQILRFYQNQKPDLPKPKLKADLVQLLQSCLKNNDFTHIKSYKKYGNRLAFTSKEDSDRIPDGAQLAPETKSKKHVISTALLSRRSKEEKSALLMKKSSQNYSHIKEMSTGDVTKDFVDINAHFDESHLKQAKVYYNTETDLNYTIDRELLPKFPWLVFDVDRIPMNKNEQRGRALIDLDPSDESKIVDMKDQYEISDEDWSLIHVFDERWDHYFNGVASQYDLEYHDPTDGMQIAKRLCSIFGSNASYHYKLRYHPGMELEVCAKPSVSASHWCANLSGVYTDIEHPMSSLLNELLLDKQSAWYPIVADLILPHFVVDCHLSPESKPDYKQAIIKLLVEMAMIRDLEERFYTKPRHFTIGIYVAEARWQVFVLENTNRTGVKYQAHRVANIDLTHSYISWLQLGLVLIRLAAYQTYCTLKLFPKTIDELKNVVKDANDIIAKKGNNNKIEKPKSKVQRNEKPNKASQKSEIESDDERISKKGKRGTKRKARQESDNSDSDDEGPRRKRLRTDTGHVSTLPKKEKYLRRSSRVSVILQNKSDERIKNQLIKKEGVISSSDYTRVYRCFDEVTGKEIAIKEFDSRSKAGYEAAILTNLQGPGIVSRVRKEVTKFNEKGQMWLELLSPLPDYQDLHDLKHFMRGLLEALKYIHSKNYVHGDVKHGNVMVHPETNEIKLIDFECSIELMPNCTAQYFLGGTTVYFAPEREYDEPQTSKIDIFSAGLVCAEKMYGIRIRSMDTRELLIKNVKKGELIGLATKEGVDLLQRMLKLDPDQRMSADDCLKHPFFHGDMDM